MRLRRLRLTSPAGAPRRHAARRRRRRPAGRPDSPSDRQRPARTACSRPSLNVERASRNSATRRPGRPAPGTVVQRRLGGGSMPAPWPRTRASTRSSRPGSQPVALLPADLLDAVLPGEREFGTGQRGPQHAGDQQAERVHGRPSRSGGGAAPPVAHDVPGDERGAGGEADLVGQRNRGDQQQPRRGEATMRSTALQRAAQDSRSRPRPTGRSASIALNTM